MPRLEAVVDDRLHKVTLSWDLGERDRYDARVDSFSCHCGMGPMMMSGVDVNRDDYDWDLLRNPEFRKFLQQQKFVLVTWRDLGKVLLAAPSL